MVLEKINNPQDVKKLTIPELKKLSEEIRQKLIETVNKTGGHLAPNLGTVEAIVALHFVFDSPKDKIVFDVGHQAYAHKLLTGRKDKIETIRQFKGLAGYLEREENEHDVFGAGHTATSISAATGFAIAKQLKKEDGEVIAFIGDGALTGGLAYEALNFAGHHKLNITVILNDNKVSISPNVGAMSKHLKKLSDVAVNGRVDIETIFEKMGFKYIGPIDGHSIEELVAVLDESKKIKAPVIIHLLTIKGKGLKEAETDPTKFHGIVGKLTTNNNKEYLSYSSVFAETLTKLADTDEKIIAITAAMATGTKLINFAQKHHDRFFDVGIAEQQAITMAAGLAADGFKPCPTIYSTFLQRAFDQIQHDVDLQNLPVKFFIDRAGLVGEDGATHHGVFDIAYMSLLPNMVVMAPKNGKELISMTKTAIDYNKSPISVRYPRGATELKEIPEKIEETIEIGKAEVYSLGSDLNILALGTPFEEANKAIDKIEGSVGLINARFAKPFDKEIIEKIAKKAPLLIIEEGSYWGGFGANVALYLQQKGIDAQIKEIAIPDYYIRHATRQQQLEYLGFTSEKIAKTANEIIKGNHPLFSPEEFKEMIRQYNNKD